MWDLYCFQLPDPALVIGIIDGQKIIQIYDLKTYYVNNIAVMQLCFLPYQPAV